MLLHSLNHDPANVEAETGLVAVARADRWWLAVPAGLGSSWNAGRCCGYARDHDVDDVSYVQALIRHLVGQAGVPVPVVLVGVSNGGMLALAADCAGDPDLSLVVAVAGNLQTPTCPRARTPFLLIRGGADALVPEAGTAWSSTLGTSLASDSSGDHLLTRALHCTMSATSVSANDTVTARTWRCPAGVSTALAVAGVGHGWPRTSGFDATAVVAAAVERAGTAHSGGSGSPAGDLAHRRRQGN